MPENQIQTEAGLRAIPVGAKIIVTRHGKVSPCLVLAPEGEESLNVVTPFPIDPTRALTVTLLFKDFGSGWTASYSS